MNDNLGHETGDKVLKDSAENLLKNVRKRDVVASLGGDEFVVLLTHLTDESQIAPIAKKIVVALNQTVSDGIKKLYVTPSIGIAIYGKNGSDYETLLTRADKAMYLAKTHGKNNFQFVG